MLRIFLTITMLGALIMLPSRGATMPLHSPAGPVPDQNPVTFGPIPTQFLTAGGDPVTLTLSGYVTGMIGMPTFVLGSNTSPLVTVSLTGNQLTIEPVMAGKAQIEVTLDLIFDIDISFDVVVLPGSPWSVSDDENVYLLEGNVGIGVDDPDERLVVDGRIKAEEIHVEDVTPADYVFDEDYDLISLDDLKKHIETHGHLPGISSGAAVVSGAAAVVVATWVVVVGSSSSPHAAATSARTATVATMILNRLLRRPCIGGSFLNVGRCPDVLLVHFWRSSAQEGSQWPTARRPITPNIQKATTPSRHATMTAASSSSLFRRRL